MLLENKNAIIDGLHQMRMMRRSPRLSEAKMADLEAGEMQNLMKKERGTR